MNSIKSTQVRIIGGHWRGSKLPVPTVSGLRPTPDRIRETLFNWLGNDCRLANVLDCFAGSGVLGLEAASRGARQVTLIESHQLGWQNLRTQVSRFDAKNIDLWQGDVLDVIPQLARQYQVIFVDPPYALPELRDTVVDLLIAHKKLSAGAKIYLEWPGREQYDLASAELSWVKQKKAGQVNYAIAEWQPSG